METDQPTLENSDQQNSGELLPIQTPPARSYECTFCKRGFSNAQALGGHMNIHRKDKAKLKRNETVSHHQQSSEIPKTESRDNEERTSIKTWKQLALFDEEPSKNQNPSVRVCQDGEMEVVVKDSVDLELRLGPEPSHDLLSGNKKS